MFRLGRTWRAGCGELGVASRVWRVGCGEQGEASRVRRVGCGEQGEAVSVCWKHDIRESIGIWHVGIVSGCQILTACVLGGHLF